MRLTVAMLAVAALFAACGNHSGPNNGAGISLKEESMQALPVMLESSKQPQSTGMLEPYGLPTYDAGKLLDQIMFLLLDPTPYEADGTSLGNENLYHQLGDMEGPMQYLYVYCGKQSGVDRAPFFDTHSSGSFLPLEYSLDYDCADPSGWVYGKQVGDEYHALYARRFDNGDTAVHQGIYNGTTGDIQVRMVEVNGDVVRAVRADYFGNVNSHAFTIRLTKYNSTGCGMYSQLVGQGTSRGAGAYFLFKAAQNKDLSDNCLGDSLADARYFCYSTDTMGPTEVTGAVEASNCAQYQAAVDAITGFVRDDLPLQPFDIGINPT
jgi:hypothetical protein